MSSIRELTLIPSLIEFGENDSIEFMISFMIDGEVREKLNEDVWSTAYDKHDNLFRIKYTLVLSHGKPITLLRKASFYWSRDPKRYPLPPSKKIWVMIVRDDQPIIPKDTEEARRLLFDVQYSIVLDASSFHNGENEVYVDVKASWGRHTFIEKGEISARSTTIKIRKV